MYFLRYFNVRGVSSPLLSSPGRVFSSLPPQPKIRKIEIVGGVYALGVLSFGMVCSGLSFLGYDFKEDEFQSPNALDRCAEGMNPAILFFEFASSVIEGFAIGLLWPLWYTVYITKRIKDSSQRRDTWRGCRREEK